MERLNSLVGLIRKRAAHGRRVITPTIVARSLSIGIVEALEVLVQYRGVEPQALVARYRALCDHCEASNDVTARIDEINSGGEFALGCATCVKPFRVNQHNTVVECLIQLEHLTSTPESAQKEDVQGGAPPPCRQSADQELREFRDVLDSLPLDTRGKFIVNFKPIIQGGQTVTETDNSNKGNVEQHGQGNVAMRDGAASTGSGTASTGSSKGWLPVIIAALITGLAAIIAALIVTYWKRG